MCGLVIAAKGARPEMANFKIGNARQERETETGVGKREREVEVEQEVVSGSSKSGNKFPRVTI